MSPIRKGSWVEIEKVLLQPSERAANLPEDTAKVPYVMRVTGFLEQDGEPGQEVSVRTLIGNIHTGILTVASPGYTHSFGPTVPELLRIGREEER